MDGERWRVVGYYWCHYDESKQNPFRYANTKMNISWCFCDGETEWEQDILKNIITIEKWLCRDVDGEYYTKESSNLDAYKGLYKIKLLDSYEVEIEGE
jgi:hypothetical protein